MKKIIFVLFLLLFQGSVIFSQSGIINTVAGINKAGFSGDGGPAIASELYFPVDVTFDASGNYYIADRQNNVVRKVDISGTISTIAGNYSYGGGYSGDGGPATDAELSDDVGVLIDSIGNMYIADNGYSVIRKVNTAGIITTIAGTGVSGFSGDGGPATSAELSLPCFMAMDISGNLFFADANNNLIRMIDTLGIITTVAGNHSYGGGYSGNGGPATAAELLFPEGVNVDWNGNIFIADAGNSVVRKVNSSGIISTIAGIHHLGFSGDGGPATAAEFNQPCCVTFDASGNMYIADEENFVVRMVNTAGIISTVAGNHSYGGGYSGDGGPATAAELADLSAVAFDSYGNMFIADEGNSVIREVTGVTTGIPLQPTSNSQLLVYPNPAQNVIYVQLQGEAKAELVEVYSITGQKVQTSSCPSPLGEGITFSHAINTSSLSDGVYFLKVQMQDGSTLVKKVEIMR